MTEPELKRGRLTSADFERLIEYRPAPVTRYAVSTGARGMRLSNRSSKHRTAYNRPTENQALRRIVYSTQTGG